MPNLALCYDFSDMCAYWFAGPGNQDFIAEIWEHVTECATCQNNRRLIAEFREGQGIIAERELMEMEVEF